MGIKDSLVLTWKMGACDGENVVWDAVLGFMNMTDWLVGEQTTSGRKEIQLGREHSRSHGVGLSRCTIGLMREYVQGTSC